MLYKDNKKGHIEEQTKSVHICLTKWEAIYYILAANEGVFRRKCRMWYTQQIS